MRNGFFGSLAALAASAGLAWGQVQAPPYGTAHGPSSGGVHGGETVVPASGYGPPVPIVAPPMPGGIQPTDPVPFPSTPTYPPVGGPPFGNPALAGPGMMGGALAPGGGPAKPGPHFWFNGEYLLWFMDSQPLNFPLLTTGSPASQGVLGQPTTGVLFDGDLGYNTTNGGRISIGMWMNENQRFGWEATGLILENDVVSEDAASSPFGLPVLARPFINVNNGQQTSQLISFPQFASGLVSIDAESQVWGAEGNMLVNLFRSPHQCPTRWTINWLGGFRYFQLQESIRVHSFSRLLPGNSAPFGGLLVQFPAEIGVTDFFETRNGLYGGQLGLQTEVTRGKWTLQVGTKVALGNMNQRLDVIGQSTIQTGANDPVTGDPPPLAGVQGGLLANVGNIGRYRRDEFGVLPELTVNVGCNFTRNLMGFVGYNLIYMSDVLRAGAQINPAINPGLVPTSFAYGQPGFTGTNPITFREESVWLQGINFGLRVGW